MKNLTTELPVEKAMLEWKALRPEAGQKMGCWVAFYDIADPKRLNRVHRLMSSEAVAIQKSVFLVSMSPDEVTIFTRQISELIDISEDRVDFIRLPRNVKAISLGKRLEDEGILLL